MVGVGTGVGARVGVGAGVGDGTGVGVGVRVGIGVEVSLRGRGGFVAGRVGGGGVGAFVGIAAAGGSGSAVADASLSPASEGTGCIPSPQPVSTAPTIKNVSEMVALRPANADAIVVVMWPLQSARVEAWNKSFTGQRERDLRDARRAVVLEQFIEFVHRHPESRFKRQVPSGDR